MADGTIAPAIPLHQPSSNQPVTRLVTRLVTKPRPLTGAERTRAYRERQRAKAKASGSEFSDPALPAVQETGCPFGQPVTLDVTPAAPVKFDGTRKAPSIPSIALRLSAAGLALVGLSMNAMYAHSLGSSDLSGWLFLALGVAADCAALALPSVLAVAWNDRQQATALAGWLVWLMTFAFALSASVGFASVNVTDVTMARAGRVTPAVTASQATLSDAMAARDRECKGGVGRFCRERETAVETARRALAESQGAVAVTADPQTQVVAALVTWATAGRVTPGADDVGNIRLLLLALLPQVGGILLMVARRSS